MVAGEMCSFNLYYVILITVIFSTFYFNLTSIIYNSNLIYFDIRVKIMKYTGPTFKC